MENEIKQFIDIEIVKMQMKLNDIDEKQLAKLMGATLPTIKRFLNGANQKYMSGTVIYKLAIALNVTAHSLLHKKYR